MNDRPDDLTLDVDLNLEVRASDDWTVEGVIVPFDTPIRHSRGVEQFARGAFSEVIPSDVPLLWHHDPREPIGVMTSIVERDDGAHATFRVADTARGRDYMALAREGVTRGLSVGFDPDGFENGPDGVRTHTRVDLREVSAVTWPAYAGARLATRQQEDTVQTDPTTDPTTTTDADETLEIRGAVDTLRDEMRAFRAEVLDGLNPADDRADVDPLLIVQFRLAQTLGLPMPEQVRAVADVVADLGTADASGLTPDSYWAGGLQMNVDARRPTVRNAGAAEFPAYGNNLVTGRVSQYPEGESGVAQKTAITSTALEVEAVSFPIVWHKIALDIAIELAEQGNPDALGVASRAMLRWYALATDVDAVTKVETAATASGTAFSTYSTLAAIAGALVAASETIEAESGAPGDIVGLSPTNWATFVGLTGASGIWDSDTPRDLLTPQVRWAGFTVYKDSNVTEAIQYNSETVRVAERNPIAVAATNVEKFGYDRGYMGATAVDTWDGAVITHEAS